MALIVDHKGLNTLPSPYLAAPGCMTEATNVVIDRPGVITTRYGFTTGISPGGRVFVAGTDYDPEPGVTPALYLMSDAGVLWRYGGGFSDPLYDNITGYTTRFLVASRRMLFTSAGGVRTTKPDAYVAGSTLPTIYYAGIMQPPDPEIYLTNTPAWFANGSSVAYRVTFSSEVAGELVESPPSSRVVITNTTGASATPELDLCVPARASELPGLYINVYRTDAAPSGAEPGDEMYLACSVPYTRYGTPGLGVIAAVYDTTDEDELGEPLYTNATVEGIESAAYEPPIARELAQFRGQTCYANTSTKHSLDLQLISVTNADNSTFSIGPTSSDRQSYVEGTDFTISTASPSNSVNIRNTAMSLVHAINRRNVLTTGRYVAYYASGPQDPPGIIRIVALDATEPAFTAVATRPAGVGAVAWFPSIPTSHPPTTTGEEWSQSERVKNRIYFSKYQQPQAVPLDSWVDVGASDKEILRIAVLRETLFVFKADGLYKITGDDVASVRVDLVDENLVLVGTETLAAVDGALYCLTQQGVVPVAETGIGRPLSLPIDPEIGIVLSRPELIGTAYNAFAVGHTSEHRYLLWFPSPPDYNLAAYVYHTRTGVWTKWTTPTNFAIVKPDDHTLLLVDTVTQVETPGTYQDPGGLPISVSVAWTPVMGEHKSASKQFSDLTCLLADAKISNFGVTVSSDWSPTEVSWTQTVPGGGASQPAKTGPIRMLVPREHQYATMLKVKFTHSVAQEKFQIAGFYVRDSVVDERSGR